MNGSDKILEHIENLLSLFERFDVLFAGFSDILISEEGSLKSHDVAEFEQIGRRKTDKASEILDTYKALSECLEQILLFSREHTKYNLVLTKLSDLESVLDALSVSFDLDTLKGSVICRQLERCKDGLLSFLHGQKKHKESVERNVRLISALQNNHRQSYQFWREAIARETLGYDQKGSRPSTHAVSMFTAKV